VGRDSTEAVSILAEVLLKLGQPDAALHWATVALQRARAAGNRKSEALALECLGRSCRALGRHEAAQAYLRDARTIYAELGRNEDALRIQKAPRRLDTEVRGKARLRMGSPRSVRSRPNH